MQMIKGAAAGLVALVACPCHLPLTIPLLLLLTSGTAAGLWLATNQWFVWAASTALFVAGLGLAFLWLGRAATEDQCEIPQVRRAQAPGSNGTKPQPVDDVEQNKEASHV